MVSGCSIPSDNIFCVHCMSAEISKHIGYCKYMLHHSYHFIAVWVLINSQSNVNINFEYPYCLFKLLKYVDFALVLY